MERKTYKYISQFTFIRNGVDIAYNTLGYGTKKLRKKEKREEGKEKMKKNKGSNTHLNVL